MAYEVLIDPKLRQDYDATLAPAHARVRTEASSSHEDGSEQGPSTRVDMDWLPPKAPSASTFWPPSRRMMIVGGGATALLVMAVAGTFWQVTGQQQMEKALSDQYARNADQRVSQLDQEPMGAPAANAGKANVNANGAVPGASVVPPASGRRKPTVAELSRMSDEELMKVLPTLDNDGVPNSSAQMAVATRGRVHHPLDGKPLNLRVETQLVDPLAPEPLPAKGKAKP